MSINTKYLFFDFGGVIADSFDSTLKISKEVLGLKNAAQFKKAYQTGLPDFLTKSFTIEQIKKFFKGYENSVSDMPIVPTMAEVIKRLSASYGMAIVTSAYSDSVRKFLIYHEIDAYFSDVLGFDDNPNKTKKINLLIEKYQLKPDHCLMITDTAGDIKEATGAQVVSVGVLWGYHSKKMLFDAGAKTLAEFPNDLITIANRLL